MIGGHLVRLIERHADDLAEGLTKKLRNSDRTSEFRKIPEEELKKGAREIYHNLGDWLLTKTESDIEVRYTQLGTRRATQGVPIAQFVWATMVSKEHLFGFLQREVMMDGAVQLYGELELVQLLDQFFDRALYFAVVGYEHARMRKAA
jgi:translation initiation factor 2 beta subunit (eIF-2beta)/eIF-5